jgi:redox-sensing transcriptional repressor
LPRATVDRLPRYLRALDSLEAQGVVTTSSVTLSGVAGVGSAQLRKDLSFLGSHGRRGVGYDVSHLRGRIAAALGVTSRQRVVIVGVGNLGHALANYSGFGERGFTVVGLVDVDPAVVGSSVSGLVVRHLDELEGLVGELGATIAVLAVPSSAAQRVCDRVVAAGVGGVLSFSSRELVVPTGVDLRTVDVGAELQILAFHGHRRQSPGV